MRDLNEMQFEILPSAEADEGIGFGIGMDVSCDAEGFKPGGPDWYTEDSENPINGSTSFGRDHLIGPTWQWDLHVNRDRTETAVETLGDLATSWRAENIRDEVGAVLAIRYRLAGRDRRIFGRPRRFEYSPTNLILGGYVPISADFKCADANTYDDLEDYVLLDLAPDESDGGLILPAVLPYNTQPSSSRSSQCVVDGNTKTYPIIRFTGPVVDPSLETNEWIINLNMTIADGEYVEVDTRPWVQTVIANDTTSVAGALGRRQYLEAMTFKPGTHELMYRGSSSTDGSTCEVRWRSAWNSI
jgi:hypothetical protein